MKTAASRVISYIESSFWACRAAEFDVMCRVAYRETDRLDALLAAAEYDAGAHSGKKFDAMLAKKGERLNGTRYVEVRENGVAVIDVNGILAKRMDFFTEVCEGGTSTETLMRDFNTALNSPNVSSVLFNIDSPGGEAFGINELAQAIYDARGKKPMKAYVSGLGCSGAYWIASAADEVIADKSAFLGSIGVVTAWTDDKGFYKALGIRREVVTSTNAPFKRLDFDNEEHRAELQRELDSLESVFHKAVARNRKVTVEQVKTDFNRGGVLSGIDAVKAKMADRTGSLEQVIKELARKGKNTASGGSLGAENNKGEMEMGFKDEFKAFAAKLGFSVSETVAENESPAAESQTPAVIQGNSTATYEAERARAEKAEREAKEAREELARVKAEKLASEADDFIKTEVNAGRMIPAERESFKLLYLQAAADDESSPLAEGSRLDNLKTIQEKRKPHGLTTEILDPKAGLQALSGEETETAKLEKSAEKQADDYVATAFGGASRAKLEAVK
jgi:capsid assembly protease